MEVADYHGHHRGYVVRALASPDEPSAMGEGVRPVARHDRRWMESREWRRPDEANGLRAP
jgi:hypothetical protein